MNVAIFGYGFVGRAHEEVLSWTDTVMVFDPAFADTRDNKVESFDYDCAFICVATPQSSDGSCDMSNVYDVMDQLDSDRPILIKSTISLEGWKELKKKYPKHHVSFSPEFLRQDTYFEDFISNKTIYIGSEEDISFWERFFTVIDEAKVIRVKPEEAILIKYFRNSFLATKVAFFNQIYDLCENESIDFDSVRNGICEDPRIGHSHSVVTSDRGFGGHCFPKDTLAIIKSSSGELSILENAIEYNNRIKNPL